MTRFQKWIKKFFVGQTKVKFSKRRIFAPITLDPLSTSKNQKDLSLDFEANYSTNFSFPQFSVPLKRYLP